MQLIVASLKKVYLKILYCTRPFETGKNLIKTHLFIKLFVR